MKKYNCPDCNRTDSCDGCFRIDEVGTQVNKVIHIPKYFPDSMVWYPEQSISPYCKNCSNHPSNGGSGICNCILGNSVTY